MLSVTAIWIMRAHAGPAAQSYPTVRDCMCKICVQNLLLQGILSKTEIQQGICKGRELELWSPLEWQSFVPSSIPKVYVVLLRNKSIDWLWEDFAKSLGMHIVSAETRAVSQKRLQPLSSRPWLSWLSHLCPLSCRVKPALLELHSGSWYTLLCLSSPE